MPKRERKVDVHIDFGVDFGEDFGKVQVMENRKVPMTNTLLQARGKIVQGMYSSVLKAVLLNKKAAKVVFAGFTMAKDAASEQRKK